MQEGGHRFQTPHPTLQGTYARQRVHPTTHDTSAKPKMPMPPTSDARQNHRAVWRDRGRQSCVASCAALA